ncbi:MAG: hypothetical protein Q8L48_10745 [Archangium sp.]|nr:hypothetical protein [Archangium sp.]
MRFSTLLLLALVTGCAPQPGAPVLREVEPAVLESGLGGLLQLRGEGFLPAGPYDFDRPSSSSFTTVVSATLEQGDARVELTGVTWVDPQHVDALVPPGVAPGLWSVRLITPRGVELSLADALRVEAPFPDGGLPDGGLPDGGLPDGGPDDGGAPDAGPQPCQTLTFHDGDGDGFGVPDSGALLCGPGRVLVTGDCNDVDALTSPAGVEVCNELDDDCDGTLDDAACGDAGFARLPPLASTGADFLSTSAWGPDQVWIAGGSLLFVHDGDAGFSDLSANCPMGMNAVWVDPSGRAFVGGGNNGVGRLTTATRGAGCAVSQLIPEPVAGLVGFTSPDGGVQVEAVLRDGRRVVAWDGVGPPQVVGSPLPGGFELFDAHGASPGALYAVGGTTGTPRRPAVFRLQDDGGFVSEVLPTQNVPDGQLHGVWVVSPGEVVAVGDRGMVLRRVDGAWERIAPPSMANYTTVRAFSIGRFYLSTEFGYLRQWHGRWTLQYTDQVPVRDLTAYDEEHFWLVGDNGLVIRGPLAP